MGDPRGPRRPLPAAVPGRYRYLPCRCPARGRTADAQHGAGGHVGRGDGGGPADGYPELPVLGCWRWPALCRRRLLAPRPPPNRLGRPQVLARYRSRQQAVARSRCRSAPPGAQDGQMRLSRRGGLVAATCRYLAPAALSDVTKPVSNPAIGPPCLFSSIISLSRPRRRPASTGAQLSHPLPLRVPGKPPSSRQPPLPWLLHSSDCGPETWQQIFRNPGSGAQPCYPVMARAPTASRMRDHAKG